MTEQEATKKWCPFSSTAVVFLDNDGFAMGGVALNRDDETPLVAEACLCLASRCMAWQPDQAEGNGCGDCGLARR